MVNLKNLYNNLCLSSNDEKRQTKPTTFKNTALFTTRILKVTL